ncbi:MAG: tellurium resistance protein TerC [Pseudomonadota bacterium]
MAELFSIPGLFTLAALIALQAVLGFDNLLYISIESKRVGPEREAYVRRMGIALAVLFRLVLLFLILQLFDLLAEPLFGVHLTGVLEGDFTVKALVTLLGGAFIIYTATKEIAHMLAVEGIEHTEGDQKKSVGQAIFLIVSMNLVFSFDSILSAMALSENFYILATAIIISGVAMVLLADYVAEFLKRNRMYEVLGLFILFIVGVLLVSEGGHLAHLKLFGFDVEAMSKSSFYLVIFVLVVTDVIQTRYQKRLWAQKEAEIRGQISTDAAH